MAAPVDEWRAKWGELRARGRRIWYQFFGLIALLLGSHAAGLPEFVTILLAGPVLLWIVAANRTMREFRCPRCGNEFFSRRVWLIFRLADGSRRECAHCGLKKFASSKKP